MGGALPLEALAVGGDRSLAHHGVADDEGRTLLLGLSLGDGVGDGVGVGAVHLKHVPVPGAVFGCDILVVDSVDHGRQLHTVAVVEHYQVVEAEVAGDAPCSLRDFLLYASVGDEGVGLMGYHIAETRLEETLTDCASDGHGVALPQRAGCVLDAPVRVEFWMARAAAAPLAQLLKLLDGEFPRKGQHRVEHRRHVARVEEETVAGDPLGIVRIGHKEPGIKHVDEVGTAHGAAGMARLCFLHHGG